jgi:hypothetical protein
MKKKWVGILDGTVIGSCGGSVGSCDPDKEDEDIENIMSVENESPVGCGVPTQKFTHRFCRGK